MSKIFNTKDVRILGGTFGLERETLRVTAESGMAQSLHPFPDDEHIVKDFCENQAEINTGVHNTAQGAIDELSYHSNRLSVEISKRGEKLWLYSNPPIIKSEDDIPVAVYEGDQHVRFAQSSSGNHARFGLHCVFWPRSLRQQRRWCRGGW